MSVKFACPKCFQTLVAEERKIGRDVECPRCAATIVVPDGRGAADLLERKRQARAPSPASPAAAPADVLPVASGATVPSGSTVAPESLSEAARVGATYAGNPPAREQRGPPKLPAAAQRTTGRSTAEGAAATAAGVAMSTAQPAPAPAPPGAEVGPRGAADSGRVSLPRWVLYAQAALMTVVAVGAFSSGLVVGGGRSRRVVETAPAQAPAPGPVEIGGTVHFRPNGGKHPQADGDAVVIALPAGAVFPERIKVVGLRPQDPAPTENHAPTQILESLDGGFARVDRTGRFRLTLRPGGYLVLAISKHAQRPKGQAIPADDLALLGRFFTSGPDLVGGARYALAEHVLSVDRPLEIEF